MAKRRDGSPRPSGRGRDPTERRGPRRGPAQRLTNVSSRPPPTPLLSMAAPSRCRSPMNSDSRVRDSPGQSRRVASLPSIRALSALGIGPKPGVSPGLRERVIIGSSNPVTRSSSHSRTPLPRRSMVEVCSASSRPGTPSLANRNRYRSRRPGVTSSTLTGTLDRRRGCRGGKPNTTRPPTANTPSALASTGVQSGYAGTSFNTSQTRSGRASRSMDVLIPGSSDRLLMRERSGHANHRTAHGERRRFTPAGRAGLSLRLPQRHLQQGRRDFEPHPPHWTCVELG